ncbi:MAG: hypothetical protein QOF49_1635 [Chloroflexota bacterium]|nr:hypothetical protein [Chloroflexota bacterium]
MGHRGGDEDDRAGLDVADLVADGDPAAARDHVVRLVLAVRLLKVRLARRQDIQAQAQVRDAQELEVRNAGRLPPNDQISELVGLHRRSLAASGTAERVRPYDAAMDRRSSTERSVAASTRIRRAAPRGLTILAVVLIGAVTGGCDIGPTAPSGARSPVPSGIPDGSAETSAAGSAASGSRTPAGSNRSGAPGASAVTGPFDPAGVRITVETVVAGLEAPLGVVNAGDGSARLFVVQQGGQVRVVRNGRLVPEPFLDIADRITSGGEQGLLGLAFHPDFPRDPRLFVDYTDDHGDTRISSFRVDPVTPDRVDPTTERRLLFVDQPYPNHNGGAIVFGPDGFLRIALGDGGGGGDPQGNGQNLGTLLGKILRIDVDGTVGEKGYGIPADNPYADGADGRRPEIWLSGLRNPWRMSVDRGSGDLWIGDVGQSDWEEVDVQRSEAAGGTNFGWNRVEATHCYRSGCDDPALTGPVSEYGHDQGCTVIGGNVYRGSEQPALAGGYVFGDYCSGRLWTIDPGTDAFRQPAVAGEMGAGLSAFGEDESGELYATVINDGRLVRVIATRG